MTLNNGQSPHRSTFDPYEDPYVPQWVYREKITEIFKLAGREEWPVPKKEDGTELSEEERDNYYNDSTRLEELAQKFVTDVKNLDLSDPMLRGMFALMCEDSEKRRPGALLMKIEELAYS